MATNDGKTEGVTKHQSETVVTPEPDTGVNEKNPATLEELSGSVDVVLIGRAWTRPDPKGGRTRTYRKGARFTVTDAEWKLLGEGIKPTLRLANEDDQ